MDQRDLQGHSPDQDPAKAGTELEAQVLQLFTAVYEFDPQQRDEHLRAACADDLRLRSAVDELLRHYDEPAAALRTMAPEAEAAAAAQDPAAAGAVGYRIIERIGRGGMGVVYRAVQRRLNRVVALKVLPAGLFDPQLVLRFEREVEVLGLLQHPGICRIYDAGSADLGLGLGETPFFAMELVDGTPLTRYVREHGLDAAARCALMVQVCDATQHAHERGVIHRDLKPANILVTGGDDRTAPQAKVLDFGIARTTRGDLGVASIQTLTGSLLGTPLYMSPEQLTGSPSGVDARSDVYALGVILYELLAGKPPLDLADKPLAEIGRMVAEREPPLLGRVDRRWSGDLETIAAKALEKNRTERYGSAAELAEDLRRFLRSEPITARRQTAIYQLRKFARRNRALVGGVLTTFAVLVAGLVAVAWLAARNQDLADREITARQQAEATGLKLRRNLYRAEMRLAGDALQAAGGIGRVSELVADWLPAKEPGAMAPDLRGFEWYLLWSSCHEELRTIESEPVPYELRWLRDGRLVSSHWHTAVVWDPATGAALQRFDVPSVPVAMSYASVDGTVLVQSVTETQVRSTDLATGAVLATFDHPGPVRRCALTVDGSQLACCVQFFGVVVWETRTGRELARLPGGMGQAMAYSADGRLFATSYPCRPEDVGIRIWRTDAWATVWRELRGAADNFFELTFDASAQRLASCGDEGWLRIWDVDRGGNPVWELEHPDGLRRLAFQPGANRIAVGCKDYTVHLHDLTTGDHRQLRGHRGIVAALAWSPDGDRLATVGDDSTLRLWDPTAAPVQRVKRVRGPLGPFCQLQFARDADLTVVQHPNRIETWRLSNDELHAGSSLSCADGRWSLRESGDDLQAVPDGVGPAPVAVRSRPFPGRTVIEPHPHAATVAVGTLKGLSLWDLDANDEPAQLAVQATVSGLSWNGPGDVLAAIDGMDVVYLFERATGRCLQSRSIPAGTLAVACAPRDDLVAIGCVDQVVRLWWPQRDHVVVLRGHTAHVQAVAFAPDGARLASGDRDGAVKLWDVAAGSETLSLPMANQVLGVAWSPDGQQLAAVCGRGEVVVWDASAGFARVR